MSLVHDVFADSGIPVGQDPNDRPPDAAGGSPSVSAEQIADSSKGNESASPAVLSAWAEPVPGSIGPDSPGPSGDERHPTEPSQPTVQSRKADHLSLSLHANVEVPARAAPTTIRMPAWSVGHAIEESRPTPTSVAELDRAQWSPSPWDSVELEYLALPEVDMERVDLSVSFLGKRLALPLLIGSMTGGTEEARTINRRLAEAAHRTGIGMGLGSQRILLDRPELAATFDVRDVAPEILLIANVGAVQLNEGLQPEAIRHLADTVRADAVVFHLNAAQEAIQPEGDTRFAGLTERLRSVIPAVGLPVGVKEVGSGFSARTALVLANLPLAWIETAGQGGTSWTRIEGLRAPTIAGRTLGERFADWGIHTVTSLLHVRQAAPSIPTVASGGLRSGLDAAKALALGSNACAMALPMLKAAARSTEAVVEVIEQFERELRVAMFLVGAPSIEALRRNVRTRIAPHVEPWPQPGTSC